MLSFSLKPALLLSAMVCCCLMHTPALAKEGFEFDDKSAVIFAYFSIGDDSNPNASLRAQQFLDQAEELRAGEYNVQPLPKIIAAFEAAKPLPPRTIALTFDGADKSILDVAAPYLIEHEIPFTVFIPAGRVEAAKPPYMGWSDLKSLKKTGLVTFGLHPADYSHMAGASEEEIRRQINNSMSLIRKRLGVEPALIAYPFGEFSATFKKVAKAMGFKAAFGQQSGVAWAGDDLFALPRFTQTERYGDLERFRMTANALPLPVSDLSPIDPRLATLTPAIGFTVPDVLAGDLKSLSCFSSTDEKPKVDILNKRRVELRMEAPIAEDRPRINCTLPAPTAQGEDQRWRWLGMLYTLDGSLLKSEDAPSSQRHAADSVDDINIE